METTIACFLSALVYWENRDHMKRKIQISSPVPIFAALWKQGQPSGSQGPGVDKARFMLGILLSFLFFVSSPQATHPDELLPFDPFDEKEIEAAVKIAREDPRVAQELPRGARFRTIVVQLHEEALKQTTLGRIPRRADMLFYRYDDDVTLSLLVDLGKGNVELFEKLTGVQPPLLKEESSEALEIALKNEGVRERLKQQRVDPQEVGANGFLFRERAPCETHRCVMLSLHTANQSLTVGEDAFFPIVDLSVRRVDHIETLEIAGEQ